MYPTSPHLTVVYFLLLNGAFWENEEAANFQRENISACIFSLHECLAATLSNLEPLSGEKHDYSFGDRGET